MREKKPSKAPARRKEVAAMIAALTEEQRKSVTAGMVASIEGHGYSWHNTISILCQRPGATVVGGFRQWQAHGRAVCKGEGGLLICLPLHKADKDRPDDLPEGAQVMGDEKVRFSYAWVWDISQTRELEAGEKVTAPKAEDPEEAPEDSSDPAFVQSGGFRFEHLTTGAEV